jgi:hypothetical protein
MPRKRKRSVRAKDAADAAAAATAAADAATVAATARALAAAQAVAASVSPAAKKRRKDLEKAKRDKDKQKQKETKRQRDVVQRVVKQWEKYAADRKARRGQAVKKYAKVWRAAARRSKRARVKAAKAVERAAKAAQRAAEWARQDSLRAQKVAEARRPTDAVGALASTSGVPLQRLRQLTLGEGHDDTAFQPNPYDTAFQPVSRDDFNAHAAQALAELFADDFFIGSINGDKALHWVADKLRPPAAAQEGEEEEEPYSMRCLVQFEAVLREMHAFYMQLFVTCGATKDVANAVFLIRREWKLGSTDITHGRLQLVWDENFSGAGGSTRLILFELEQRMFRYYAVQAAGGEASEPAWEEPALTAEVPIDDKPHVYYVVSWALYAVTKKVWRLEHAKSAEAGERWRLARLAQYLRNDAAIADAPSVSTYVDEVEHTAGAMFRASDPAWSFGEALELRIHSWVTVPRLAVLGNSLIGQTESRLNQDKTVIDAFDLCFPPNIADLIGCSRSVCEALRRELLAMVIAKTMRCRAKYFSMEARDQLRSKISQCQATRAKLRSKAAAALPGEKGKAQQRRTQMRTASDRRRQDENASKSELSGDDDDDVASDD